MDEVYCNTFSKSRRYIASGYRHRNTLIWDVKSGEIDEKPLEGHTESYLRSLLVRRLVSCFRIGWRDNCNLKCSNQGNSQCSVEGSQKIGCYLAFSPIAEYIVSVVENSTLGQALTF